MFRIRVLWSVSGSDFFFLSPDPDLPKIRINEKNAKNVRTSKNTFYIVYHIYCTTLDTILLGQVPPKPLIKENHLGPISLLKQNPDGSGSGFLKSGSGSAKKLRSIQIRIRITDFMYTMLVHRGCKIKIFFS